MTAWPVIAEAELLERLALDDAAFDAYALSYVAGVGLRECDTAAVERALGYPWSRPERSYLLDDGEVSLLNDLDAAPREDVIRRFTRGSGDDARIGLLAIGSNGAPGALRQKFAHFDRAEDRTVLVLAGHLADFDVGVAPRPTVYGSLPATIFPSPGTAMRCAVLWVTSAQFVQLTWSELSYRLGRLATRFTGDEASCVLDEVLVFVSRFGALCVDGQPVALAAIPAIGRTATPLTQEQLLDHAAALVLGADAAARDLVRAIYDDMAGLATRAAPILRDISQPFVSDRWTPFGASDA